MTSTAFEPTPRTTVRRRPQRGVYDWAEVHAILDEAVFCHVGFVVDGQPVVLPTIHARIGDQLYVHGSVASNMLRSLRAGVAVCITVTLLDGLVLARSAFHHSLNYRSAVIFGAARDVTGDELMRALDAVVEHVVPGRTADARPPSPDELKQTTVLAVALDEASAKVRTDPPLDDEADYERPVWAGVLPLHLAPAAPVPDPRLPAGTPVPSYVTAWSRQPSL
jgi:uncharacterized protein